MNTKVKTQPKELPSAGLLLSPQERRDCERLASGKAPYSQWAQALLAVDEGATQSEAAQRTGLTSRQVRYWLAKYRKVGMDIFPQDALASSSKEPPAPETPGIEIEKEMDANPPVEEKIEPDELVEANVEEVVIGPKAKASVDKKKRKKDKPKNKKKAGKKGKAKKDKQPKKSKKDAKKKSKKKNR